MSDDTGDLERRYERLNLLYSVSRVIHSTLDPQEALQLILREAVRLTGAASGSIVLFNPTSGLLEIEALQGLPETVAQTKLEPGRGITGWVARSGRAARVSDVARDPRYVMVDPAIRSELAVPLEIQGEMKGVINVDSDRVNAFRDSDQELLEALALEAALVVRNTWLFEQVRSKARLLETLVSVGQTVNSTLNLNDALSAITREATLLVGAKMCSLVLLDETGECLDLKAAYGAGEPYTQKPRLNVADSLLGAVVRRKKPIQVADVTTSAQFRHIDVAREEGLVSLLSVPLIFTGQAIGTLNVYMGQAHSFSDEEIRILTAMAALSAIAIEKARLYERIVDVEEQLRRNEKLSALGLLAAEVAHEIRNPLTVMKMLYHSMDLDFSDGDPRQRDAEIMGQKMDQLNRIVEQVLDFARSTEPQFERVEVNRLIDELSLLTRHKLRNQGVQLVQQLADDNPTLQGDPIQLGQAFLNLTLNALQAMPHGGTLTIRTFSVATPRDHEEPSSVVIEFKDSGEGMSEAQRQRAFTSLLSTTKVGGSGLGLAIVRRVVETHRGKVTIKSRPGRGTSISLALPSR